MRCNIKKTRRPWESFNDCTVLEYNYDRGPAHPTSLQDKLVTVQCQKTCWREDNNHCFHLICWTISLIVGVLEVGQAWFPLHKCMLSIPDHILILFVFGKILQNYLFHHLPRNWGEAYQPVDSPEQLSYSSWRQDWNLLSSSPQSFHGILRRRSLNRTKFSLLKFRAVMVLFAFCLFSRILNSTTSVMVAKANPDLHIPDYLD